MSCPNKVLDEDGEVRCDCGDDGLVCESCEAELEREWRWLLRVSAQTAGLPEDDAYRAHMRDAGRRHLVKP